MKSTFITPLFIFLTGFFLMSSCTASKPVIFSDNTYTCPIHHEIVGVAGNGCGKCGRELVQLSNKHRHTDAKAPAEK